MTAEQSKKKKGFIMKNVYLLTVMTVAACGLIAATASAQEQGPFTTSLSLGATLNDGNSETMQANASLVTEGEKKGLGSLRAGVEANYGETTTRTTDNSGAITESTDTTIENARIFAGAKKTITELTFGSLNADVLYDDISKIDYRATLGPGLGLYVIKNDRTSLSVETGPSYIWEKVADVSDDYLAIRFAERCDYAFSNTAKVWQSLEYLPKADDFDDYLMNAELGAEAALNSRLNLRLVLQNKYDSTPGPGLEENDLSLVGGIGLTL